ncbi:hypothetical protein HPB50_026287 [Hyalomma asiaticum]|uniref:Uncharacterized protein n=1 Tax=Hyalomma asiaticum TaxID=266040 RepID=A0ACB7TTK7_HYAAI|nr:hypothetical protein HPB50_026287 [Hyalomma asiaticum]
MGADCSPLAGGHCLRCRLQPGVVTRVISARRGSAGHQSEFRGPRQRCRDSIAGGGGGGQVQSDHGPPSNDRSEHSRDAYQRPGSDRLKVSVVIASALVAISVVVGVVVVLVVHLRAQQQMHCACTPLPQAAALKGRAGDLSSAASGSVVSKLPIPLKLQLDPLAGQMLKKNQRAQVSCVVEKKKASEVIAHEPRTLMTPFGNMTTEPRMVHLTGERMIFSCLTGTRDEPRGAGATPRGPAGTAAPGQGTYMNTLRYRPKPHEAGHRRGEGLRLQLFLLKSRGTERRSPLTAAAATAPRHPA